MLHPGPPGRRNSASQRRPGGSCPASATSSILTGARPVAVKASISARVMGHGGQGPASSSSARASAMTTSVPPGATMCPMLPIASRRGGSGSAWTVWLSTTRSNASRHPAGGASRSATW